MKSITTYHKGRTKGKAYMRFGEHIYMISKKEEAKLEKARKEGWTSDIADVESPYTPKWVFEVTVRLRECRFSDEIEPLLDEYLIRNEDGTYDFARKWYPGCESKPARFDSGSRYDWEKLELIGAIYTPRGLIFVAELKNGELRLRAN